MASVVAGGRFWTNRVLWGGAEVSAAGGGRGSSRGRCSSSRPPRPRPPLLPPRPRLPAAVRFGCSVRLGQGVGEAHGLGEEGEGLEAAHRGGGGRHILKHDPRLAPAGEPGCDDDVQYAAELGERGVEAAFEFWAGLWGGGGGGVGGVCVCAASLCSHISSRLPRVRLRVVWLWARLSRRCGGARSRGQEETGRPLSAACLPQPQPLTLLLQPFRQVGGIHRLGRWRVSRADCVGHGGKRAKSRGNAI